MKAEKYKILKKEKIMRNNISQNGNSNRAVFLITLLFPFMLCGCHTMEGAGTDIQQAGRVLEQSAEKHKDCCAHCSCCHHQRNVCREK